jgi:hemerythrin-like domain-containing protein
MKVVSINNGDSHLEKVLNYVGTLSGAHHEVESIIDAILMDHQALKKFIKVLKDENERTIIKKKVYGEFVSLLKSHSSSEEKAMYELSIKVHNLKQQTLEGYVQHKVANTMANKITLEPSPKELPEWLAQVQVLAELVEHHIEEEESDLLPEVRSNFSQTVQAQSCRKFMLRRHSQKNITKENAGALA